MRIRKLWETEDRIPEIKAFNRKLRRKSFRKYTERLSDEKWKRS